MYIVDLFEKGGLVMWPLLLCSLIAVAILVERIRTYRRARSNMGRLREEIPVLVEGKRWQELDSLCREESGLAAQLIAYAAKQNHSSEKQVQALQGAAASMAAELRKYLNYLSTIVTLAPLLGLLGTVTGMIDSFSVLSVQNGEPFAITGGVGEALIATATGLCVAVIALVIHTYLAQQEDNLVSEMEEASAIYMTALVGDRHAA